MKSKFPNALWFLLPLVFLLPGCSSFNRDWKKAEKQPKPDGIAGRWEGTWNSDANGHSGKLRCLIDSVSDTTFRARFDSTYKKILHFKLTVVMTGMITNGVFQFDGEAKLPSWAGGIYDYEGKVTETDFFSTYRCKYDHGTFRMTRPE